MIHSIPTFGIIEWIARNIFHKRYQLSELDAGTQASYLLAGGVVLYPVVSLCIVLLRHRLDSAIVRIGRRQFETASNCSPALPAVLRASNLQLFLACPITHVDMHTNSGNCCIWNRCRILSMYAPFALIVFVQTMNDAAVLLVVIVPQLVPMDYVSTALGMHKSVSA